MSKLIDLTGHRFGRLVALKMTEKRKWSSVVWACVCDCGVGIDVRAGCLHSGNTKSCGCLRKDQAETLKGRSRRRSHGHSSRGGYSGEYNAWRGMRARCSRPKINGYERYGGRGIRVCDRWQNSFEAFFSDMGTKPSPAHTLDRINSDGHYEPGNVRWATPEQQDRNRRTNRLVVIRGKSMILADAIRQYGARSKMTIRRRLRTGWDAEKAILTY